MTCVIIIDISATTGAHKVSLSHHHYYEDEYDKKSLISHSTGNIIYKYFLLQSCIFNITIHPQYYLQNNFAAATKTIAIIPLSVFLLSSCSLLTQSKQIFKTNKLCCSLIKFFFQKELSFSTHYIFLLLYC